MLRAAEIEFMLGTLRDYSEALGWPAALHWALYRFRLKRGLRLPDALRIRPAGIAHPVTLRSGTSDPDVLRQVFFWKEYECVDDLPEPRLVIDLGANIGLSSVYFLNRFPSAQVLAVEPDPENYAICCKNLAPYGPRARVLLGAAWSQTGTLTLSPGVFGDGRAWATQVREREISDAGPAVPAWDMVTLLRMTGFPCVDLLKIDIEQSEAELFSGGIAQWLPQVRNICIELHGPDCEEVFWNALADYAYDATRSAELVVCRNLRPRQEGQ